MGGGYECGVYVFIVFAVGIAVVFVVVVEVFCFVGEKAPSFVDSIATGRISDRRYT